MASVFLRGTSAVSNPRRYTSAQTRCSDRLKNGAKYAWYAANSSPRSATSAAVSVRGGGNSPPRSDTVPPSSATTSLALCAPVTQQLYPIPDRMSRCTTMSPKYRFGESVIFLLPV